MEGNLGVDLAEFNYSVYLSPNEYFNPFLRFLCIDKVIKIQIK